MEPNKLKNIISKSLDQEQFLDFQIDLTGTSGVTDGYIGDITYVKVICKSANEDETTLDLVIKSAKIGENITEYLRIFIDMYFNREILVYAKIFPLFKKFEEEKRIGNTFEAVPKCYKCLENEQIIVLENLKTLGYTVHDRKVTLNKSHLNLILQEFGKFHALSFALQDQKPNEFADLLNQITDIDKLQFDNELWYGMFTTTMASLQKTLKERNELDLLSQLDKFLELDFVEQSKKLLNEKTSCQVITYVDAWNNNFMFLYEQNDPIKVKIIDWQMTNVRNSPIYDIAHFLYTCSSPEDLNESEILLKIYYNSFSKYLIQLGSDPEKLFDFNTLKQHWKRFSSVAFIYVPYVIKQSFWDETDAPTVETGGDDWNDIASQIVIKDEEYYVRLFGVVKHFLNYTFTD